MEFFEPYLSRLLKISLLMLSRSIAIKHNLIKLFNYFLLKKYLELTVVIGIKLEYDYYDQNIFI